MNANMIEARNELGGNYKTLKWADVDSKEETFEVSYVEVETGAHMMRFFKTDELAKAFAERLQMGSKYKLLN